MNALLDMMLQNLMEINWDGPAIFVVIILAVLLILRRWAMLMIVLLTIVLGWGAQDLIITNLESNIEMMSLPFVIYCVGGGTVILLVLISFFKSSV